MEPHTGGRRPVVASDADQALSTLCQTYWYPLYAYLRRRGHAREDTRDLTQAFFVKLLEEGPYVWPIPAVASFVRFC
jgi:DNA-directed RNA polymerase specialized sigma24 family protein